MAGHMQQPFRIFSIFVKFMGIQVNTGNGHVTIIDTVSKFKMVAAAIFHSI